MSYFIIELCSDLCVSNGESYGSVIDTDIAYDHLGFPVIRGKILKGCLRETAEELLDMGMIKEEMLNTLFGEKGNASSGILTIQDAHPANYPKLLSDARKFKISREKLLGCYSYTRGQTRINENGTAEKDTLRTTRVLHRGLTFLCEYTISVGENTEEYKDVFENCLKLLRHIGMNRTRGLGEIRCKIISDDKVICNLPETEQEVFEKGDYLEYIVETLAPLIASRENEHLNHIPGSTLMGLCFQTLGQKTMQRYLAEGLIFTNAFISDGKNAFYPNPAFLAKQKEAAFTADEHMPVYVFGTEACEQADPPALAVKGMHIAADVGFADPRTISVSHELNYHHQQAQDNPGIIAGDNFYQLSSLCTGQRFMGRIYGTPGMLAEIQKQIGTLGTVNLGYYRSSGYGKCRLTMKKKSEMQYHEKTDHVVIWLHSAAILYDEAGMPCAKPSAFVRYFNYILSPYHVQIQLNEKGQAIMQKHLRYTELGGYNVTWGLNKQVFQAYAGGTVFAVKLTGSVDIGELQGKMLGERTSEGYGEFEVFPYDCLLESANDLKLTKVSAHADVQYASAVSYSWECASHILGKRMEIEAAEKKAAEWYIGLMKNHPINSTQVGRLMLMVKESKDYAALNEAVSSIKDDDRKKKASGWIELPEEVQENLYQKYLLALLTHAKYVLRRKDDEN